MSKYVTVEYRTQIGPFLNEQGLLGSGVEIGVASGALSENILSTWKGQKYYMVDPWCRQPKEIYREDTSGVNPDLQYARCCELAKNDPRIVIMRMYSVDAAKQFEDGTLDFVYIDGNHSFEAVTDDITAWWPKVKIGGVFGGHDYGTDTVWPNHCDVKRVVDIWAVENKQTVIFGRCTSWWVMKWN